jgi:hypothetical protein
MCPQMKDICRNDRDFLNTEFLLGGGHCYHSPRRQKPSYATGWQGVRCVLLRSGTIQGGAVEVCGK